MIRLVSLQEEEEKPKITFPIPSAPHQTHREKAIKDTGRRQPSTSKGEKLHQKPILLAA